MSIGHKCAGGNARIVNSPINLTLNFNIKIRGDLTEEQENGLVRSLVAKIKQNLGVGQRQIAFSVEGVSLDDLQRMHVRRISD